MVDTPPPTRTRAGAWMMAAPMILVGAIALAFGVLVLMVRMGGEADGQRVQVKILTDCAAASAPIIAARMAAMGLGNPELKVEGVGIHIEATLPKAETDHQTIPKLLAQEGQIRMLSTDGKVRAHSGHITGAGVEIDNSGMPTTLVEFDAEAKAELKEGLEVAPPITVDIDGETVAEFTRLPDLGEGHLELPSGDGATSIRMRRAADRSILLSSGALPCQASVTQVVQISQPG